MRDIAVTFSATHHRIGKPPRVFLKVNFDSATFPEDSSFGVGLVVRNIGVPLHVLSGNSEEAFHNMLLSRTLQPLGCS